MYYHNIGLRGVPGAEARPWDILTTANEVDTSSEFVAPSYQIDPYSIRQPTVIDAPDKFVAPSYQIDPYPIRQASVKITVPVEATPQVPDPPYESIITVTDAIRDYQRIAGSLTVAQRKLYLDKLKRTVGGKLMFDKILRTTKPSRRGTVVSRPIMSNDDIYTAEAGFRPIIDTVGETEDEGGLVAMLAAGAGLLLLL